ncbi:MAG TPA: Zn-dependent protease [Cyanobacteria bacterium UBA8156]|jgi:predicted Zn-dependent protease|nr:Zn-dependent protease [Cyanobacteria bacterium UBA8156]
MKSLEDQWEEAIARIFGELTGSEITTAYLQAERSDFTRFNRGAVRQTGWVEDATLTLTLLWEGREAATTFPLTSALEAGHSALATLRQDVRRIPPNPYTPTQLTAPQTSREVLEGHLLSGPEAIAAVLTPAQGLDMVGLYAAGPIYRACATSVGHRHWFSVHSAVVDYSLVDADGRAVKGVWGSQTWDDVGYQRQLADDRQRLTRMALPVREVPRGEYRAYLAPAAVAEIVDLWRSAPGEGDLQQGQSPLRALVRQERLLSPWFSLEEDFRRGGVPRFNKWGEVAPARLPIVTGGQLVNTLVSERSAREYGKSANGATAGEYLRAPAIAPGDLPPGEALARLGTGLYLSNLHYLNWSDVPTGRLTGMTRFACFWVEDGELVAPIERLRFDDSFYRFWGEDLEALGTDAVFVPNTDTYERRSPGGLTVPGMLLRRFTFTL